MLQSNYSEQINGQYTKIEQLKKAKPLPKYKSIFQIQNSIKFLNISKLRKQQAYIALAEQILNIGQRKFGGESKMWSTIALYHSSFSKNNMHLTDALTNMKQAMPNILERWQVFVMMHELENKQSSSGSNQLGVTFRIRFAKASKDHELSKNYLCQAYMNLSKDNMDLERIMNLLDKAILHERESRLVFEELMKLHPNSTTLLRGFGALLRDIYRDDETALLMFNQATSIEEEQTTMTKDNSDGQSQMQKSIHSIQHIGSIGSKGSDNKSQISQEKKKKKKKNSNKSSLTLDLTQDKKNLIPGFLELIIICMAVITICLLISFIFVINTFQSSVKTVTTINDCTEIISYEYDLLLFSKYFGIREDESIEIILPTSVIITGIKFRYLEIDLSQCIPDMSAAILATETS
ncbi:MAG: hypothetical protein EZS28_039762, partial [Streblomastix strix]